MRATDHLKPLFNRRLLAEAQREIPQDLDEEQRKIAESWATSAANGSLLGQKEKPLQGQFLSEFFGRLLGYRQLVGAEGIHHMEPETSSGSARDACKNLSLQCTTGLWRTRLTVSPTTPRPIYR